MPVNLRELPDELIPPRPPNKVRWLSIVLLCSLAGSGVALLLWPGEIQLQSLWFWCCVLVFPLAGASFLFGLRQLIHENRLVYVESWNSARADMWLYLLGRAQLRTGLLTSAYCTPAGSNRLAEALRKGSKPLHSVFQPATRNPINTSLLVTPALEERVPEYEERLTVYLDRVLAVLLPDLQRLIPGQAIRVRIRHNQVLSDDSVLVVGIFCKISGYVSVLVRVVELCIRKHYCLARERCPFEQCSYQ